MGRHSAQATKPAPMTRDQALAILAYDIADLIDRNDGYDGLIPDDAFTQDNLITLLPDLFRAAGFDPFAAKPTPEPAPAEDEWLTHTCNNGRGPFFGRLQPDVCRRCAQREEERKLGIPPREAPARIQESRRQKELDEQSRLDWEDHIARKHRHGRCADGVSCTFGQW